MLFELGLCAGYGKGQLCLQQGGDGGCLELFFASFLIGRRSPGYNTFGFQSWDGFSARRPTDLDNGRKGLNVLAMYVRVGLFGYFLLSPIISLCLDGRMTCDLKSFLIGFQLYQEDGWEIGGCVQWNPVYD